MASVRLDDICTDCLKAKHCEGSESWCACCGSGEELTASFVKRKPKQNKNGDWQ